ncbi:MAG TPA: hypothetical protein VLL97_13600, partial [Acidobacteriota bacterium]|nr:hypothetical protein [Acidobacteriota bacterium]
IDAGLVPADPDPMTVAWLAAVIDLVKTHVDHLDQLPSAAAIIFGFTTDPPALDANVRETLGNPEGKTVAVEFARLACDAERLTPENYRDIVARVKVTTKQKGRNLFHPIRAALTGAASGPELEKLIPLYEEGSRLNLPVHVMSCRERLRAVLAAI